MGIFSKVQNSKGWMAIVIHPDRIDLACIKHTTGGRPEVLLLDSYKKEGGDTETLARLRKELRLSGYRCITLLHGGQYQMLQVEAPAVPKGEIREAVRWRIKDMLEYSPTVATIDVLEIPTQSTGNKQQLLVVAANNAIVGPRMQMFEDAKIPLDVIDTQETAQRNISALFEIENRGLAFLAFDVNGGVLTFTHNGELYHSRRIEAPLSQLVQTQDNGRRQKLFERVSLEMQRSLDYFDREFSFIPLAKLVVMPLPDTPEFLEYLTENLYVPIESCDLAKVIDFPKIPELKNVARQSQCLHALGAALRNEGAAT